MSKMYQVLAMYAVLAIGSTLASAPANQNEIKPDYKPKPAYGQVESRNLASMAKGALEGMIEGARVSNASAGDAYASTGVMKKVPGLDYEFDGGVYVGNSPSFPKSRWNFRKDLGRKGNELDALFKDPKLKKWLGQHIRSKYDNGELLFLAYNDDNPNEVGLSFNVNGTFYIAFKGITPELLRTIQSYNHL